MNGSAAFLAWSLACVAGSAHAQTSDFYRGKTISFVVNYTSGGPTDTEARLLARHLPKHIPGNPVIVVRNMGGAGGLIGVNWLGQVASDDGLTIGYMTGMVGAQAHETPALKVDVRKFHFIASTEGNTVSYVRTDIGVKKPEDLLTKKGFWVGGLTPDNDKDLRLRVELDLLGISYRYISGYPGAAEARRALERYVIQFTSESMPTYRVSI
jgi:tripartite-type tricarboxylate transporter receptor subunit TctC